jgi:hypothetical protein
MLMLVAVGVQAQTTARNVFIPQSLANLQCPDTSGSGLVQTCVTTPSFPIQTGSSVMYRTTTPSGGDLIITVNGTTGHAKKWGGLSLLTFNDMPANDPMWITWDGTFWELYTIGNASGGGGGGGSVTGVGLLINGSASSGIFAVSGSPVTLAGSLNYNLTGSSGGIPYFSSASVLDSTGTLAAGLPLIGGGAGLAPSTGTVTGTTTKFATFTGPATPAKCVDIDASGNLQVVAQDCNTTPGSIQTNGVNNSSQAVLNFQNSGVFSWTNPSGGIEQVNFASQSANTFMAAPNGAPGVPTSRLMVAADVPTGTNCATNNFARGIGAALAPVCAQPAFSNLTGTISLAQTVLSVNGDLLSVSGGALTRVASAGGQDFLLQGANAAVPVWLAINNCGSGTQALSYSTSTHTFGCQTISAGTGTVNPALQFSAAYYSAAGSGTTIDGVVGPTTPNIPYILTSTPSGGVATVPVWSIPGVPINAQTGTSYSVVAGDRENLDTMSNGSAIAVALPQAGSSGFTANFNFSLANINTGLVTITPTTSTINGNATQIVPNHWFSYVYSDNTNYRSLTTPDIAAFPGCSSASSALNFTTATGVFGCITNILTTSSGGTLTANSPLSISSSALSCTTCATGPGSSTNHGIASWNGTGGLPLESLNTTFTLSATTMTGSSTAVLDLSAASVTAGLKIPAAAGAAPTADDFIAMNTTTHAMVHGSNGTTIVDAAAATGTNTSTTCTNQYVSVISSVAAPTCATVNFAQLGAGTVTAVGTFPGGDLLLGGVNIKTSGSPYTVLSSDENKLLQINTAGAYAITLPQANGAGFTAGAIFPVAVLGAGTTTITPTTSTINGNANLVLIQGQGAWIVSDGTNYSAWVSAAPSGSGTVTSATIAGTANQITASGTCTITTTGTCTLSLPTTVILGTDNSAAGLLQLANGSANAHTTFGSGATTSNEVDGFTVVPTTLDLIECTSSGVKCLLTDTGILTANVVTAASNGTTKQLCTVASSNKACAFIDFPDVKMIPAANCNNATAGPGWSIGSGGTVTCRAGTNNLGGFISITDTSSTFAQFQTPIPVDWDTAVDPYVTFAVISVTDTTNGHTIIPQIKVSCPTAHDGTVSDDHAFAAAHSATTITMGGSAVANGFYTTTMQTNGTDMTGCVAGGMMIVQVGRATDTATGTIGFEYANVTFPRLLTVQAN